MMSTTRLRRIILHRSQRGLTEARTFMVNPPRAPNGAEPSILSSWCSSLPVLQRREQRSRHRFEAVISIYVAQDTLPAIVVEQGNGLVHVHLETPRDGLLSIIWPLTQLRTTAIAHAGYCRRFVHLAI